MTTDKIDKDSLQKHAEGLARKYKSQQELEDLIQTGILAGLEKLQETDEKGLVISAMRSAMRNYYNISLGPLSIPQGGTTNAAMAKIMREQEPEGHIESLLMQALGATTEPLEPNSVRETIKDFEEHGLDYIEFEQVLVFMKYYLSDEEWRFVNLHYLKEHTMTDIAKSWNCSVSRVSRLNQSSLKKLRDMIYAKD